MKSDKDELTRVLVKAERAEKGGLSMSRDEIFAQVFAPFTAHPQLWLIDATDG